MQASVPQFTSWQEDHLEDFNTLAHHIPMPFLQEKATTTFLVVKGQYAKLGKKARNAMQQSWLASTARRCVSINTLMNVKHQNQLFPIAWPWPIACNCQWIQRKATLERATSASGTLTTLGKIGARMTNGTSTTKVAPGSGEYAQHPSCLNTLHNTFIVAQLKTLHVT